MIIALVECSDEKLIPGIHFSRDINKVRGKKGLRRTGKERTVYRVKFSNNQIGNGK